MIVVRPDSIEHIENKGINTLATKSVFLAGTIDNGSSEDWQQQLIDKLSENTNNITVYNPRRKEWDTNPSTKKLHKQISWEQEHLDRSDLIAMVLWDNSKSPISLLELGLYAQSNKIIVFCTKNFYRYDNVLLTCDKYNIELVEDISINTIAKKISDRICF